MRVKNDLVHKERFPKALLKRARPKRALDYVNMNVDKKIKWGIEKWNEKIMKTVLHAVEIIQKEMRNTAVCQYYSDTPEKLRKSSF